MGSDVNCLSNSSPKPAWISIQKPCLVDVDIVFWLSLLMCRDTSEEELLGLLCSKKRALNDLSVHYFTVSFSGRNFKIRKDVDLQGLY